jgi:hypothetical protein
MMASANKVRLVVGLLGTSGELTSALADLESRGLRPSQINVIAQADAFNGALAGWRASGAAQAGWIVCRPDGGPVPWTVAAADGAAPSTSVNDARALLGFHHWSLRRHARQLHLYLEQGGALLLVEPDTEAEERAACTALLRHASGGVQTHEIVRSKSPEEP